MVSGCSPAVGIYQFDIFPIVDDLIREGFPLHQVDQVSRHIHNTFDLVQWEAFPDQIIDYRKDIELIDANRWTTSISPEEFKQVTGTDAYPDFLKKDVENDTLKVYCNGDIVYKIKGVTAKVSVIWNYTFPKGGGDTHFSVMKGSKADLVIRQGKEQNYQPELFVEAVKGVDLAAYEKDLTASMEKVSAETLAVTPLIL